MFGRQREQHAGCVVLDSALAQPRLERGRGRAVEGLVAEMLAYAREVIDPGSGRAPYSSSSCAAASTWP